MRTVPFMSNDNQDGNTLHATQENDGTTSSTGLDVTPSSHNLGTLHESHSTVKPSIASMANAGVMSIRSEWNKDSNPRSSTKASSTVQSSSTATGSISDAQGASYTPTVNNSAGIPAKNVVSQRTNSKSNKQHNAIGSGSAQGLPSKSYPSITGENVKDWHHILITIGKVRGEAVVNLATFIISRKYAENPLRATALAADLLEDATEVFCENISTLVSDGWDQSLGALFSCARKL